MAVCFFVVVFFFLAVYLLLTQSWDWRKHIACEYPPPDAACGKPALRPPDGAADSHGCQPGEGRSGGRDRPAAPDPLPSACAGAARGVVGAAGGASGVPGGARGGGDSALTQGTPGRGFPEHGAATGSVISLFRISLFGCFTITLQFYYYIIIIAVTVLLLQFLLFKFLLFRYFIYLTFYYFII